MRLLITGGAGFIGCALLRHLLEETTHELVNLDLLDYAANRELLEDFAGEPRYRFVHGDVGDGGLTARVLAQHTPDAVVHLAAQTHVDRSLDTPESFARHNVLGTLRLLQSVTDYWNALPAPQRERFRFLQVSTDEVFGGDSARVDQDSPYRPHSPYAASKAGADHFARAWHRSYGLPVIVSHSSNNYGPGQFPDKLVPRCMVRALRGESIPLYGDGTQERDWLYVDDHARALQLLLRHGRAGESYSLGADDPLTNLDMVRRICALLDAQRPGGAPHARLIEFVSDRPGHDHRYRVGSDKLRAETGWRPEVSVEQGLRQTLAWYLTRFAPARPARNN